MTPVKAIRVGVGLLAKNLVQHRGLYLADVINKFLNCGTMLHLGSGGGLVVSLFTFYSDDLCSNPAEAYSSVSVTCLKRTKINKKRPRLADLKNCATLN